MVSCAEWTPGPILPEAEARTVPVSIRMPRDLYEALGRYSKKVGARKTYLILECLRRLLASNGIKAPAASKSPKTPKAQRKSSDPRSRRKR